MTVVASSVGYVDRPRASGLADVVDLILDKGLVIDVFLRVSLLGLELLTVDARIVVASVDTYLRFAEAVDRVVLGPAPSTNLKDLIGDGMKSGAKKSVKGAAGGAKDSIKDKLGIGDEDEEEDEREWSGQRSGRRR